MLGHDSSRLAHAAQNAGLILLSLLMLPLSSMLVLLSPLIPHHPRPRRIGPQARTILVTGVGMTKGLALARLFHLAGHRVVGADFGSVACGRFSRAVSAYYPLSKPTDAADTGHYVDSLVEIVKLEHVDIWVSCSGVASAVQDGQAKEAIEQQTRCKCVQFDVATTQILHEKDTFIEHVKDTGLAVPETVVVTSRGAALDHLALSEPGRYIMKPIGMDDASRGSIMTLLPKATVKDTRLHVDSLGIRDTNPFILQQFIRGDEYCTHALVVAGRVKIFCACPSADMLMHYEALPHDSALAQKMLAFTETLAAKHGAGFTGHLSFDFLVDESDKAMTLYPIECNPRAHTAVALFRDADAMARAYLTLLGKETSLHLVVPDARDKVYWLGHDLVTRLLLPVGALAVHDVPAKLAQLALHLLAWRDGTYAAWDPMPFWALYHVYWPLQLARALAAGTRWSRLNVSTTKMFVC